MEPTLADKVGVEACERVVSCIGVGGINQTEMQEVAFFLVHVGDELLALESVCDPLYPQEESGA